MTLPFQKNGNIERVRAAIYAGAKDYEAMMLATGLDRAQVVNACKRIKDIRRDGDGWVPERSCALANTW